MVLLVPIRIKGEMKRSIIPITTITKSGKREDIYSWNGRWIFGNIST
jgi:hypothetical protein